MLVFFQAAITLGMVLSPLITSRCIFIVVAMIGDDDDDDSDSGKREKYAAQGESETSLHPRQSGCCSFHDSPWPR